MTDNFWEQRKLQIEQEKQAEKERKAAERKEKQAQQSATSAIPQQQQPSQQEKPKKKPATPSQQKKKVFKKTGEHQQQHNTSSNGTTPKAQASSSAAATEDPDFQTVERKTGGRRQFHRKPKKNFEHNGEKKKNNNNSNFKEEKKEEKPTTTEAIVQPAQVKVFASPAAEASTTSAALTDWASLLKPTTSSASRDASSTGADSAANTTKKKQDKKTVVAKKPVSSSSSETNGPTKTTTSNSKPQKDFESGKNLLRSTEVEIDSNLLDEVGVFIQPRGMTNINNSCYMNAVLQTLVSLPQFYHLMKKLGKISLDNDEYPLTNKMARLVNEFQVMKGSRSQNGEQKDRKYFINASYEKLTPSYIVDYIQQSSTNLEDSFLLGTQHDAHEFLTYLLERLHEELKKTETTLGRKSPASTKNNKKGLQEDSEVAAEASVEEDEWKEVGKKNKSNAIREHEMGDNSAISRIFCGKMKSFVQKQGEKGSAVVEPFFSLHLPIKDDNIKGIKFALREMTKEENVSDKNAKTTIYQLPKVLILHLRRFDFSATEGIQKISKRIRFDYELIVDEKVVPNIKTITGKSNLRYRLASVICHHGKDASGGHYSTFIQHGCGKWIHVDDTKVTVVSLQHVLDQQAYILTYVQDDNQEHYTMFGEGFSSSPLFNDSDEKKEKKDKKKDSKQEKQTASPSVTQTTTV
ncbi:hypothetical protein C9374_005917 [Naegleria lovaniensis]|uniref:ubiquitinyl hydrolase 1 n=1 Tax=Naegleria lovaniensis TaxID=51637 RepID=A0AA88GQB4_NAELO|nr:uncharacterized protein C9374_005917 [Naegleria lovaniensis]KAG2382125.1 hypothetical protein C9374_005917 [Naegleria lovaniensis]